MWRLIWFLFIRVAYYWNWSESAWTAKSKKPLMCSMFHTLALWEATAGEIVTAIFIFAPQPIIVEILQTYGLENLVPKFYIFKSF